MDREKLLHAIEVAAKEEMKSGTVENRYYYMGQRHGYEIAGLMEFDREFMREAETVRLRVFNGASA
jgi:hypothetical protein